MRVLSHSSAIDREVARLLKAGEWFREFHTFGSMPDLIRKRIAGIIVESGQPDWRLFGSMKGAGVFMHEVHRNNPALSEALERIPNDGAVRREDYEEFVAHFKDAFRQGRSSSDFAIATATRLLAMKRPDSFVCVDSKNKSKLCNALNIRGRLGLPEYWTSVCERIYDSAWWSAPRPHHELEADIWDGRATFLDSLYYTPDEAIARRHRILTSR